MNVPPVKRSKNEIDLSRLLFKCELRGREFATSSDWRLEKYIETAHAMLLNLVKSRNKPSQDVLNDFTRRIDFLRKLVETKKDNPIERVVAVQMMSHTVSSSSENLIKEIHQKTTAKYVNDIRNELFGNDKGTDIRLRKDVTSTGEDLDLLLKNHQARQERITEDMLLLTRNLKEQSYLANRIIKKDIETMSKSKGLTDNNTIKLNAEAEILAEYNNRAWKCWLWVILVIVLVVFINMVLFMKFMKKRAF